MQIRKHDSWLGASCVPGILVMAVGFGAAPTYAQEAAAMVAEEVAATVPVGSQPAQYDLTQMSVEELMNVEVEVTLASRKPERLFDTTSATYIITQDDIRRSGMTTIPDLLRMVPGMQVDSINSNSWLVTCRGLGDRFGSKLLVLIDGRSVYATSLGGVWWDAQDTVLSDIERIEIIRGPGATMWGANAVNGVINIITKNSEETQGVAVSEVAGSRRMSNTELRYGGTIGDTGTYRFFGKNLNRGNSVTEAGGSAHDAWKQNRGGFRMDLNPSVKDSVAVQGQGYDGRSDTLGQPISLTPPFVSMIQDSATVTGGDIQAEWTHRISEKSSTDLLLYWDKSRHADWRLDDRSEAWNLDFTHRFAAGDRHDVVWGLGARSINADATGGAMVSFNPTRHTDQLYSAFVQDDIALSKNKTRLTLGSKFEHNSYTGFEIQPSARFLWTPNRQHSVWAAASRATRTPNWDEQHGLINVGAMPGPYGLPIVAVMAGSKDFGSEDLTAYETGYRVEPNDRVQFDATAFYNIYDNMRIGIVHPEDMYPVGNPPQYMILPITMANGGKVRSYGAELSTTWKAAPWWKVSAWYSYLHVHHDQEVSETTGGSDTYDRTSPRGQFHLRSYMDLPHNLNFNSMLYSVGSQETVSVLVPAPNVPRYTRLDLRLGWKPNPDLEYSIGVQNALGPHHSEYKMQIAEIPALVERSAYASAVWSF